MSQLDSEMVDDVEAHPGGAGSKHAAELAGDASSQRWSNAAIHALLNLPFNDLIHRAQLVHRRVLSVQPWPVRIGL